MDDKTQRDEQSPALTAEELEQEEATALPDREEMAILNTGSGLMPVDPNPPIGGEWSNVVSPEKTA